MSFWKLTGAILTALVLFVLLVGVVVLLANSPSSIAGIALLLGPLADCG